jgi:hypothetical protein
MDTSVQIPEDLKSGHISDGSELKPAEVAARSQREGGEPPNATPSDGINTQWTDQVRTRDGYTVDQEGLTNNYAVTPTMYEQSESRFGFTRFAETLNGRLAMLGFIALILIEAATGQGFFSLIS